MPLVRPMAVLALLFLTSCSGGASTAVTPTLPSAGTTVSYKADIAPLLSASCAGCHTPGGMGSQDIVLFDASGNLDEGVVSSRIDDIISQTQSGRMPQRGTKLTAAQVGLLQAWKNESTPNN